jgi:hypothetical protein
MRVIGRRIAASALAWSLLALASLLWRSAWAGRV